MEVTLEQLKRQCNVDYDDDDATLLDMAEAAEEEVIRRTERTREELQEMGGGRFPAALRQAILVRVGELFANREGTDKPNMYFESQIRLYQKL